MSTEDTPPPWNGARDANMEPQDLVKGKWFSERSMTGSVPALGPSIDRSSAGEIECM